jgi:hypothetical protein
MQIALQIVKNLFSLHYPNLPTNNTTKPEINSGCFERISAIRQITEPEIANPSPTMITDKIARLTPFAIGGMMQRIARKSFKYPEILNATVSIEDPVNATLHHS